MGGRRGRTGDPLPPPLAGSSNYEQALGGLTEAGRAEIIDTAKSVFSEGVGDSFATTGLIALGATLVVFLLWPKGHRRRSATGPG